MFFAGCGQAADNQTQTSAIAETTTTAAAVDKSVPVEGKTYVIKKAANLAHPVDENAKMVKYWEDRFNVDFQIINLDPNSWQDSLNVRLASGDIPDYFPVSGNANLVKYYNQGVLANIPEDYIKTYAPNIYSKLDKESPGVWNYCKVDGNLAALPYILNFDYQYRRPVIWRGDWLKNVGITKTPETLTEFEDAMYKFANNDPDKNGKKDTYGLSQDGLLAVYGALGYIPDLGAEWFDKDGKLVYAAVQSENKEALKLLNKWYNDGVLDPEFITGENSGGYWALSHSFINGRIGYTSHGNYYHWKPASAEGDEVGANLIELSKTNPAAELIYGLPPTGPDGKMGVPKYNSFADVYTVFGKQLEDEPDKMNKILQIAEYMGGTSFENYATTTLGIKGEDWDLNADGAPVGINGGAIDYTKLETMGANWAIIPVTLLEYETQVQKYRAEFCKANKFDIGGVQSAFLPALPSEPKYLTELQKMETEAYIAIITGDKPVDYFDQFVDAWNKAGGQQLVTEANEAYAKLKQ